MTLPLDGRVAVVTDAARGQGRAHAIRAAALGPVRIVASNARDAPLIGGSDEDETFADVIDVNRDGAWNTVRVVAPSMVEAGRGGATGLTACTASKHCLVGLTRSFANWLAPHSIRVNRAPDRSSHPDDLQRADVGLAHLHPGDVVPPRQSAAGPDGGVRGHQRCRRMTGRRWRPPPQLA